MATVTEVIAAGRRDILNLEPDILADLLRMYDDAWRFSERQIGRYEAQIQAAIDRGETVRESWLRQQVWYRQLQASIDAEMSRFQSEALQAITRGQRAAVGIATETAVGFTGAVGISPGIVARVNAPAFERWVSALRPDSPIRGVMGKYGPRVEDALMRHITDGIGSGQGTSNIIRAIRRDVGTDAVGGRLQTVARTETLRAYRGANRDAFEAMGPDVISEWEWVSAKSTRTCLACLAMDGRRFPFKQYPDRFHVACRCTIRAVPHASLIPPRAPRETGSAWLARQDAAAQRKVLGTQGRWELYQQGTPLDEFVGIKTSRTWGDSVVIKPASDAGPTPGLFPSATPPVSPRRRGIPDIEVPRFKSTAEAESWLRANIADEIVFGKQNLAAMQSLANGLGKSLQPYGIRINTLDFTRTKEFGKKSRALGRYSSRDDKTFIRFQPTATASTSNARKVSLKSQQAFEANKAQEIAAIERRLNDPKLPEFLRERNEQKLRNLQATERWASFTEADDPLEAIATHEAGHGVYYVKNLEDRWDDAVRNLPLGDRYRVSEYGASSNDELFAEAFTMYRMGLPLPPSVRRAVEETLDAIN